MSNVRVKEKEQNRGVDWIMILVIIVLVVFGLIMVYSASSYEAQTNSNINDAAYYVKKQLISTFIGVVGFVAAALIPIDVWKSKISYGIYALALFATFLVLSPLGIESNGAKRWIDFKVITLQPAEFLKVGVVLCMAALIYSHRDKLKSIKGFVFTIFPAMIAAAVVAVVTDDLGTAIIIFAMGIIMIALVSPQKKHIIFLVAGVIALGVIFVLMKPYRMTRIKAWLNLEAYAENESYQSLQALYAIASGGLFGKGLGKSTQKLGFIPESENDMIFSIVCEEMGIIGGLCLLGLIAVLIWRMWRIYRNTDSMFEKLIVAGVMAHVGVQTFINMGVVSSLLPNTGVPLPFISYGGSSIMMLLVEMGLVIAVGRGKSVHKQKSTAKKKEKTKPVVREDKDKGVIYYQ